MMNGREKSDSAIVAVKPANNTEQSAAGITLDRRVHRLRTKTDPWNSRSDGLTAI
jgi:hypothetical protein